MFGAILFLLGVLAIHEAAKLPVGTLHAPGPGFFPFWLGWLLAVLALLILAGLWLGKVKIHRVPWTEFFWQKCAWATLVLFVYALVLDYTGYVAGTFVLLLVLLRLLERKSIFLVAGISAFISLGTYFLCKSWLLIQLPRGMVPW